MKSPSLSKLAGAKFDLPSAIGQSPSNMQSQATSPLPFAILAPVPEVHLESAFLANLPLVAFGSNAWEAFRRVDEERKNQDLLVTVSIYASWLDSGRPAIPKVTWRGLYVKHLDAKKPLLRREALPYRPSSTKDEKDWAVYWLVKDLHDLPESQHIEVSDLRGWRTKSTYSRNFIPEGPLLIEHPHL